MHDITVHDMIEFCSLLNAWLFQNSNAVPSGADMDMMDSELTTEMCNYQDRTSLIHNEEQISSLQTLKKVSGLSSSYLLVCYFFVSPF